jgi:four helix bundle protein
VVGSNEVVEKSYKFSLEIIKICLNLPKNSAGYAISNQLIRSGTSIGANIEEAQDAMSRADFAKGMSISLKEARETKYWLKLLKDANLIDKITVDSSLENLGHLLRILTKIVKTVKSHD